MYSLSILAPRLMGHLISGHRGENARPNHLSAVAIVNNPTQLLFAIEAAYDLGLHLPHLDVIVVPTPRADDTDLYSNLIQAAKLQNITWLPLSSLGRLGRLRDLLRLKFSARGYEWIITPMVNYIPVRALISSRPKRVIVTDDGAWTLHFAKMRYEGRRSIRRVHRMIPLTTLPRELAFFSIYRDLVAGPADTIKHNDLQWCRSQSAGGNRGDHLVILGSDFVGSEYLTFGEYVEQLKRIRAVSNGVAEYWPHRREDPALVHEICELLGLKLRKRRLPLEAEILQTDPAPALIATLPSTATETLKMFRAELGYRILTLVPDESTIRPARLAQFRAVTASSMASSDIVM